MISTFITTLIIDESILDTGLYKNMKDSEDEEDKDVYKFMLIEVKKYIISLFTDRKIMVSPLLHVYIKENEEDNNHTYIVGQLDLFKSILTIYINDMLNKYALDFENWELYKNYYTIYAFDVEVIQIETNEDIYETSLEEFINEKYDEKDKEFKIKINEIDIETNNKNEFECPICMCEYKLIKPKYDLSRLDELSDEEDELNENLNKDDENEVSDIFRCKSCKYEFCKNCLNEILHRTGSCPCCRKDSESGFEIEKLNKIEKQC